MSPKRIDTITVNHLYLLFSILFLWILFSFCSEVPDYRNYAYVFQRLNWGDNYHSMETGYWLLCKFATFLGLDFSVFRKIYGLIGLTLMGSTAMRYMDKPYRVFLLYLLYPFLLDLVQIRHFMACSIVIYGIRYLEEFKVENVVKYSLCVLLAVTQHSIAIVYLVFLFAYLKEIKIVIRIAISVTIVFFVLGKIIAGSTLYRTILASRGIEGGYIGGIDIRQFVLYSVFYILLSAICVFLWKNDGLRITQYPQYNNVYNQLLFKICMLSVVFIPIILIDFQLTRLFRGCVFILEMYIVKQIDKVNMPDRFFIKVVMITLFIVVFVKLFGPSSAHYATITKNVFFENYLWHYLL